MSMYNLSLCPQNTQHSTFRESVRKRLNKFCEHMYIHVVAPNIAKIAPNLNANHIVSNMIMLGNDMTLQGNLQKFLSTYTFNDSTKNIIVEFLEKEYAVYYNYCDFTNFSITSFRKDVDKNKADIFVYCIPNILQNFLRAEITSAKEIRQKCENIKIQAQKGNANVIQKTTHIQNRLGNKFIQEIITPIYVSPLETIKHENFLNEIEAQKEMISKITKDEKLINSLLNEFIAEKNVERLQIWENEYAKEKEIFEAQIKEINDSFLIDVVRITKDVKLQNTLKTEKDKETKQMRKDFSLLWETKKGEIFPPANNAQ